jgi:hypothetical protein
MNSFALDPYEAAARIHERRCMQLVAKVMKACGVTQVDISHVSLQSEDVIAVEDRVGFLRIKGTFQLDECK